MNVNPVMVELCRRELELCALKETETVAILTQGDALSDYADAFTAAVAELNANSLQVRLPEDLTPEGADLGGVARTRGTGDALGRSPAAMAALAEADLVIDLVFLLFSPEQNQLLADGVRILTCLEPVDVLARLFPTPELRARVEAAEKLLAAAGTMRFTNEQGTDVTYKLNQYQAATEYGYTDQPGRWDHWPAGFVFTGGDDDGVDGRVVLAPGDIIFPFRQHIVNPIEFTIEQGRIIDVRGEGEGDMLRDYMASFNDPDAYAISHIGWGLDERAKWWGAITDPRVMGMEVRSYYGNVLFSTGPNGQLGGTNNSACHLDMPMLNCDLYLDDELIIRKGEIIPESMRVDR